MQRFARVQDGVVREIIIIPDDADINTRFHPGLVKTLVDSPDVAVVNGYLFSDGQFTAPPPRVVLPNLVHAKWKELLKDRQRPITVQDLLELNLISDKET